MKRTAKQKLQLRERAHRRQQNRRKRAGKGT